MIRLLRIVRHLYLLQTHCVHEVGELLTNAAKKLPRRSAASSSATDALPPANIDQEATEQTKKSRPHSISSTGITARQSKKSNKDPSKDARNIIFDMTGVGTDLRQSSSMQATAFLRPSGVDGPADPAKTSNLTKTAPQSSTGATNSPNPKIKRSRRAGEADKPKKKTKLVLIE
ncbi:hypothetical protein OG21DRAFT_388124 [Imleria badia]|nr:hypothetical protein OG21DRAFT_388124 [Imleria badia]